MRSIFCEEQKQEGCEGRHTAPGGWEKGRISKNFGRKVAHAGTRHSVKTARGKMGAIRKKLVLSWFVSSGWRFGLFF